MSTRKSANNRLQSKGKHSKGQKVSCTKTVHPDVILDADEALRNILGRLTKLESEICPIKAENKELRRCNEYLEIRHRDDMATIRNQKIEIAYLKTRLDKLEKPKKDSYNSSVSPSKEDIASSEERKRMKSLRKPSGKKSGGQPGHRGTTLNRAEVADEFQRGFKKAGANSILMALWKVDDEATCKLMTEFYSNWIGKKMTKHDALEAAKKTVRETKGWEDPKFWAAFILLDGLD